MTFDLKPGHPLRGRVVDDAGNGVAQAWFVAATWRGLNTIHTEVRADADGRFVWDSAPEDEVICDVERPGYMTRSNIRVTAKEDEQTFVIPKTGPIVRKRPTLRRDEPFFYAFANYDFHCPRADRGCAGDGCARTISYGKADLSCGDRFAGSAWGRASYCDCRRSGDYVSG